MAPRRRTAEADLEPLINTGINWFLGLNRRAQFVFVALLLAACAIGAYVYYQSQRQVAVSISGSPNLLLGNPSDATGDLFHRDNYLMDKGYYVLAYDNTLGTPKWVSWQVKAADLGTARRKQVFDTDMTLPAGFTRIATHDYSGSGFDRGHMCPHSDRAADEQMSFATFVMTNIIPQAPNVNRKAWAQLESYSRELVREGNRLYILSGPLGKRGIGSMGPRDFSGQGKVTVPAGCWKLVVVGPVAGGEDDLAKINADTRVIAVIMPNNQDIVGEEWAQFRTSPAQVEQQTGLHFFDRLSPEVAQALRQKTDDAPIAPPRPMEHGHD